MERHTRFCRLALGAHPTANVSGAVGAFHAAVRRAWQLPCANSTKEPLWRLAVDGIPGTNVHPWRCPCDLHASHVHAHSRTHTFWECPVAKAVRRQLEAALPAGTAVTRSAVWLLGPPPRQAVDEHAWALVCLAAVAAMEYGRQYLWAHRHSATWPDPGPEGLALLHQLPIAHQLLDAVILPPLLAGLGPIITSVCTAASARFWHLLADFTSVHATMPWATPLGHPFLHVIDGRLQVNVPAAQAAALNLDA